MFRVSVFSIGPHTAGTQNFVENIKDNVLSIRKAQEAVEAKFLEASNRNKNKAVGKTKGF